MGTTDWKKVSAHWKEVKGAAKERWDELTDEDLARIDGKLENLIGTLQAKYAKDKDEIETEVARWSRGEAQKIDSPNQPTS